MPSIINTWAAGVIAAKIMPTPQSDKWRWGLGMGAIIYPVLVIPLCYVLVSTTFKAKRRGLLKGIPSPSKIVKSPKYWKDLFWKADFIGLFWLCAAIALCLIPLTLGGGNGSKWKSAEVLAQIIVGLAVCVPIFIFWEWKGARHPIIPFRLLKDRHVILSLFLALFVTLTGAQQSVYLYFTLLVPFGQ